MMERQEPKNLSSFLNPMRVQTFKCTQVSAPKTLLSDDDASCKCSIYFTNFPDFWEVFHFWSIFKPYGQIAHIYIPKKRNARNQRFGFIDFVSITDVESLLLSLNLIWIGSFKLRFYRARGPKGSVDKPHSNHQLPRFKVSQKVRSYVDIVKGDKVSSSFRQPDSKDPKQFAIMDKSVFVPDSSTKQFESSYSSGHVQISLDNGVLVFKINIQEFMCPISSDSEDSQSKNDKSKNQPCDIQGDELPLDTKSLGENQMQTVPANSSSPKKAVQTTTSSDSSYVPNTVSSQGGFHANSDSCNDLVSPCFSVHSCSLGSHNVISGANQNSKETSGELCGNIDSSLLSETRNLRAYCNDNELTKVQSSPTPMNLQDDFVTDNDDDSHSNSDCEDDRLDFAIMYKGKNFRKKKKRKNHGWSRRKTCTKVKDKVRSSPKFTVEDTCISDSSCREEASKTLEVAKLIGLSFNVEDELTLKKFMEYELENREVYGRR